MRPAVIAATRKDKQNSNNNNEHLKQKLIVKKQIKPKLKQKKCISLEKTWDQSFMRVCNK